MLDLNYRRYELRCRITRVNKKKKKQQKLQVIEIEQNKTSYGEGNQLNSANHVLVLLTKPPGSVAFRQTTLHKAFKGVLNAKKRIVSFTYNSRTSKNYKITPTTYTRLRLNVKKIMENINKKKVIKNKQNTM